ncbi:MAG TPA: hypothetical protein VGN26_16275 [Armatimonadota bacterium]
MKAFWQRLLLSRDASVSSSPVARPRLSRRERAVMRSAARILRNTRASRNLSEGS